MNPLPARLLVVLEPGDLNRPLLRALHAGGCRWFWLRAKHLPVTEAAKAVARFREALPEREVVLSLGFGRPLDLGGVDAFHLPRDGDLAAARAALGPDRLIGISAHDAEELAAARAHGADYATLSPLFPTASKPGAPTLGPEAFARLVAEAAPLAVLALGGIDAISLDVAVATGAGGVAVLRALSHAADPRAAAATMLERLARVR